jgi:hypothetical protein
MATGRPSPCREIIPGERNSLKYGEILHLDRKLGSPGHLSCHTEYVACQANAFGRVTEQ